MVLEFNTYCQLLIPKQSLIFRQNTRKHITIVQATVIYTKLDAGVEVTTLWISVNQELVLATEMIDPCR